jgi:AraC-like DNA-binding protein
VVVPSTAGPASAWDGRTNTPLEDLAPCARLLAVPPLPKLQPGLDLRLRRYPDRLRLRLTLDRLFAGEPDLTALALDLGYADPSHSTNAFRREFGRLPSALRPAVSRRSPSQTARARRKILQAEGPIAE